MPTGSREEPTAWWGWLDQKLREADLNGADLVRLSDGSFRQTTISFWRHGRSSASPETAVLVAKLLRANPAEALRAAGYDTLADLVDPSVSSLAPDDPIVQEILNMRHLGMKVRLALIEQYKKDRDDVERRVRDLAGLIASQAAEQDEAAS